jgi:hypothetical protein
LELIEKKNYQRCIPFWNSVINNLTGKSLLNYQPSWTLHRKSTQEKQLFLHVSNFMIGKIATITKTAQKKNANQKDIKLLNSANEVAACLVELVTTEREKTFQHLQKCKNT